MSNSIQFLEAELINFQSFKYAKIVFTPGRHLIMGEVVNSESAESNGSGKSSLLESIPWTLYKKSLRDKDPSHNQKGNCITKVTFLKNSSKYTVIRYHRDVKMGNSVQLFVDDEEASLRKNTSTEEEIQKIIGISSDLFISTVVVLQGLPFNFSVMTPTVRKTIIEDLLGFVVWEEYRAKVKKRSLTLIDEKSKQDELYSSKKFEMSSLTTKIETIKHIQQNQKQDSKEELEKLKQQYTECNNEVISLTNELSVILKDKTIEETRETFDALSSSLTLMKSRSRTLSKIVEQKICPECNQDYPEARIKQAEAELNSFNTKMPKLTKLFDVLQTQISQHQDIKYKLASLNSKLSSLQTQIINLKNKPTDQFDNELTVLISKQQLLLAECRELLEGLQALERSVNQINYIDSLLIPSSVFRAKVLERYLSYINSVILSISKMLIPDITPQLILDTKGSGVDIDIKGRDATITYKSLSGGEKRRLDVVLILAFQKFLIESSGLSTNLVVFDEVFDGMDGAGIRNLINSLDSLFHSSVSQYVITHNNTFKPMFDSIIKVVKTEGVSQIEGAVYDGQCATV